MGSKAKFLEVLERELEIYPWAFDQQRKARFMGVARQCIEADSGQYTLAIDGPAVVKAWQAIGGKGKPSYKALRALPDN